MNDEEMVEVLQRCVDAPPFHQFLAMEVVSVRAETSEVTIRLPFKPVFQRSPREPQIHGGVTSALIDIAGDYALYASLGHGVPTINLRIDFLAMAAATDLLATARVVKQGRSIGVVDIEVKDSDGRVIAIGRGNYSTRAG